jgi:plastocyanin
MVALSIAACGGNKTTTRLVLVDHDLDDFPTSYFGYFPRVIEAHPGDTIHFRQDWTGEPHTVTLGTLVQPLGKKMRPLLVGRKSLELPGELQASNFGIPSIFPEEPDDAVHEITVNAEVKLNQTAAQPCYVQSGPVPADVKDCGTRQPAFDGTQSFYNSGYIRFRGERRNEFDLPLADSIKPGSYFYFCVLHGPGMGGFVDVKKAGTKLTTPKGLRDVDLLAATREAKKAEAQAAKPDFRLPGSDVQAGTFSFYVDSGLPYPVSINEFMPNTTRVKVGQPVTWSFAYGPGHTVSFDVPSYVPAIVFRSSGQVDVNQDTLNPIGGPGLPKDAGEAPEDGFAVDAGNYDGSFFLSSGYADQPMRYSVTFTKPGTYPYACLLHPAMLGKVVVSA